MVDNVVLGIVYSVVFFCSSRSWLFFSGLCCQAECCVGERARRWVLGGEFKIGLVRFG